MNDVADPAAVSETASRAASRAVVRPRDSASLILLRGAGQGLELLAGRRPMNLRFMPGVYVFPGGAIDPEDRAAWRIESGTQALPPRLARCVRAALRETWEEAGVLVGRPAAEPPSEPPRHPIEQAYAAQGLSAAFDLLTYVGRAITPSHAARRFNTRFFLCDGSHVVGEPFANDEFEDVRWHPIGRQPLEPLRDVTRFMLARAIALRAGTASPEPPLFYTVGNARRVRICREALPVAVAGRLDPKKPHRG